MRCILVLHTFQSLRTKNTSGFYYERLSFSQMPSVISPLNESQLMATLPEASNFALGPNGTLGVHGASGWGLQAGGESYPAVHTA